MRTRPFIILAGVVSSILYPCSLRFSDHGGEARAERPTPLVVLRDTIQPRQSLAATLAVKLTPAAIDELVKAARPLYDLSSVLPGRSYGMALLPEGTLKAFTYAIDDLRTLRVVRRDRALTATLLEREYEVREAGVSGSIESSLFEAIQSMDEADQLALDLADIFSWDIDFNTEIQRGDSFSAVVEKLYLDRRFVRYGRILAARFHRGDRSLTAVRYDGGVGAGYYAPDGTPLRKAFLKSPLRFARITSRYSNGRYHPVLKIVRPHHGVDYAAPFGTSVMATSDGVVISSGWMGGYGKTVRLRHANGFITLYGHLSHISVRSSQRVTQGVIIGAVGSTGIATGPHLDYRMTRDNRFVNPLSVQLPPAAPIPAGERSVFFKQRDRHLATLPPAQARLSARLSRDAVVN